MKRSLGIILFFLLAFSSFCQSKKDPGYSFSHPDLKLSFPDILREVSGVIYLDSTTVACIQDENGIVFIYDFKADKIIKQTPFNFDGDYEGITKVKNTLYILRSDGVLFEISDYTKQESKVTPYVTNIPSENNEGLCYDSVNNRLLIASKSKIAKGTDYKDKRMIYAFDLKSKKRLSKPVFEFDINDLRMFANEQQVSFPVKARGKEKTVVKTFIKFKPSAIAIHPINKMLFVLSATDHALFCFDMDGKILHIEKLDPLVFNKAEGIAFFRNGDMIITNEAQDKKATLLFFKYKLP